MTDPVRDALAELLAAMDAMRIARAINTARLALSSPRPAEGEAEDAVRAERDHLAAMVRAIGKRYPEVCDMARAEVVRDSAAKG